MRDTNETRFVLSARSTGSRWSETNHNLRNKLESRKSIVIYFLINRFQCCVTSCDAYKCIYYVKTRCVENLLENRKRETGIRERYWGPSLLEKSDYVTENADCRFILNTIKEANHRINVWGLSGKYRAYLYISALALFFIIGLVASFKVIPTWLNNRVPAMFSLLETVLELTFRDGLEYARRIILSFGKSQKSQGAMSGLYGGCRSNAILCLLRNCCTRFDECAGALPWWRS